MSGSKRHATPFDDSLLLMAALERHLRQGTGQTTGSAPPLVELAGLVDVARRVEASAHSVGPDDLFRAAARARLLASMRESDVRVVRPEPNRGGIRIIIATWLARAAAAMSVVALAGAATASASASALPGDTLYPVKQIGEQLALATARDDSAQREVLFQQAETRLDETSRLLEQGRDLDADRSARRYTEAIERSTDQTAPPADLRLQADRARLSDLLSSAPPKARPGLQRAIAAADRGLGRARPEPRLSASQSGSERTSAAESQSPTYVTAEQISTPAAASSSETRVSEPSSQPAAPTGAAPAHDNLEGHGAADVRPEQPHHDTPASEALKSDPSGGAAVKWGGPDEARPLPARAVDKPHGAPVTPFQPPRHSRP